MNIIIKLPPKLGRSNFYTALTQGEERVAIALIDKKTVGCMVLKACSNDDLQSRSEEIRLLNYRAV